MFDKNYINGKNVADLLSEIYSKAEIIEQTGTLAFDELIRAIGLIDFVKLFYINSRSMIPEDLIRAEQTIRGHEMNIDANLGKLGR